MAKSPDGSTVQNDSKAVSEDTGDGQAKAQGPSRKRRDKKAGKAAALQRRSNGQSKATEGEPGKPADEGTEPPKGDAAVGKAIGRAGTAATGAAKGAGRSIMSGLGAMRDVHEASKQLSQAQADLKKLQQGLDEDRAMLAHREDIDRRYPDILGKQRAEISEAETARKAAADKAKAAEQQKSSLEDKLERVKAADEAKIRPYRNLMDSSRGRYDDAAKSLANVRRSLKTAEGQVSAATKRRDQRVSAANQAVDSAKQRLSHVQMELDSLRADSSAAPGAIQKMEAEVEAERNHITTAQQEVVTITADAQSAVDIAQQGLFAQQKLLKEAEKTAETAKAEAASHKTEHDNLYREMQAREKGLQDKIKLCDSQLADLAKQQNVAQRRIAAAQRTIAEARDIHDNPSTTQGLRERIANEEGDVRRKQAEIDNLTKRAQRLRKETRGVRIAFVVAIIVLVIVLILVLYFFVATPSQAATLRSVPATR